MHYAWLELASQPLSLPTTLESFFFSRRFQQLRPYNSTMDSWENIEEVQNPQKKKTYKTAENSNVLSENFYDCCMCGDDLWCRSNHGYCPLVVSNESAFLLKKKLASGPVPEIPPRSHGRR